MKQKFLLVISLLVLFSNYSLSQYLKLKEDLIIKKNDIKFILHKNEIYPLIAEDDKSYLKFAKDSLTIETDEFDTINIINTSFEDRIYDIAKKINDTSYLIDISFIKDTLDAKTTDTIIKIYSDKNILISSFIEPVIKRISINECGDFFRIVAPNANTPVLVYYKERLDSIYKKNKDAIVIKLMEDENFGSDTASPKNIKFFAISYQIKLSDFDTQTISEKFGFTEKSTLEKIITSYLFIIIGGLVIIGILIFLYFNYYRKKYVQKVKYKGGSITKLVEKYGITTDELYELNKEYSDLKDYNSRSEHKKKEIREFLIGKRLIIQKDLLSQVENDTKKITNNNVDVKTHEEINGSIQGTSDTKILSTIIYKLQTIDNKIDNLGKNKDVELLKEENIRLEEEKLQLIEQNDNQIRQLEVEKEEIQKQKQDVASKLNDLGNSLESITNEFNQISEKVFRVDYLENIAKNVSEYLVFLNSVETKVKEYYERSLKIDPKSTESRLLSQMLLNYYLLKPEHEIGKWMLLFEKIKNEKIIADKELINRLKEFSEDHQKEINYINRLLFKKVLEIYISNLLILCEEVKNLFSFSGEKSDFSSETESIFKNIIRDILLRTKDTMNLEVNYAPLFDNYKKHPFTRLTDKEPRNIYLNLNISKNQILEIASYGFKKINGFETEETKIITV